MVVKQTDVFAQIPDVDLATKLDSVEISNNKFASLPNHSVSVPNAGAKRLLFLSTEHGTGVSHLAFSSAITLAQTGSKVLFVSTEFNNKLFFTYMLTIQKKIMHTLPDLLEVPQKIITYADLEKKFSSGDKNNTSAFMIKSLQRYFPKSLSFLRIDQEFQAELAQLNDRQVQQATSIASEQIAETYDYVIIDAENDLHAVSTQLWLSTCKDIVLNFTQDVASFTDAGNFIDVSRRVDGVTIYPVLNQYLKGTITQLTDNNISKLIGADVAVTIPDYGAEFKNATFNGIPFLGYIQDNGYAELINDLVGIIG